MMWLDVLLWVWAVCAIPVTFLVALCFDGSGTVKSRVFILIYGVIAVVLSPVMIMWLLLELVGDLIGWLGRRA
jgi:hypothetical protein